MSEQNGAADRVAIVTGGSRGLGKNMVQNIAGGGTDVIFTYQSNGAAADELVAEVEGMGRRTTALQLDVATPTLSTISSIRCEVCCRTGIASRSTFWSTTLG